MSNADQLKWQRVSTDMERMRMDAVTSPLSAVWMQALDEHICKIVDEKLKIITEKLDAKRREEIREEVMHEFYIVLRSEIEADIQCISEPDFISRMDKVLASQQS